MQKRSLWRAGAVLGVVLVAAGCSGPEKRAETASGPAVEHLQPRTAVRVFDRQGEVSTWNEMLSGLADADIIVIGETHGHPLGLSAAAALWDDLLKTRPQAALAMEFFERDQQVALDDYLAGITDEEAFREAARRSQGNYPEGHRQMVEAAREAGRPVIAANAPRRYVRMTTPQGYERLTGLSDAQRRMFEPPAQLVEGRYRDEFFGLMSGGGHGESMPEGMVEKMYFSQQLWDSTMAASVVNATLRGSRPVVLVVGRFHADFDGATVEFIQNSRPDLTVRTVSVVDEASGTIAEEDVGRADYVFYVGGTDAHGDAS
ncbi:MAG: ChaN family lipoprotein [Phycisphaerales bacterium JB054]